MFAKTYFSDESMAAEEVAGAIEGFNRTAKIYPDRDKLLHELIEEQVARTPSNVALRFGEVALTYFELSSRADKLANLLKSTGVGPESRVGVCFERSVEMVIALLATIKAGAMYVPFDPELPKQRFTAMLKDADLSAVLTQHRFAEQFQICNVPVIALDRPWPQPAVSSGGSQTAAANPSNGVYIIYTSGSTGVPKGVVNIHSGVVNRILWMQDQFGLGQQDRVLQKTPYSFDVSVWEFFWPLMSGACLVVAAPDGHRNAGYLADLIRSERITVLHFVPSMLGIFLEELPADYRSELRLVVSSGEELPAELAREFHRKLPGVELYNLYGPTEAAVDVTYWRCRPDWEGNRIPIGFPIANTRIHILDETGQPVQPGGSGELYIAGVGVARGYWKRPELTAERFLPDPFSSFPGAMLYRTGDLARRAPDGAIEYLGRVDHQIKLRGFRIELGEIEAVLNEFPGVRQAVVTLNGGGSEPHLIAHLLIGESNPDSVEIRKFLESRLPGHMIPARFVKLDSLPLTPNGKLDRNALSQREEREFKAPDVPLPERGEKASATGPEIVAGVAGLNLEAELLAILQPLLPAARLTEDDDFFEAGGTSLTAMRFLSKIQKRFQVKLPLATIVEARTVRDIAGVLRNPERGASWSSLVPLKASGSRAPLFLVHAIGGQVIDYKNVVAFMPPEQPLFALQAQGLDGQSSMAASVEEMAAYYLRAMRTVQPHGPYFLGGWSAGGIVAFEIARQIAAEGDKVGLLALFDTVLEPPISFLVKQHRFPEVFRRSIRSMRWNNRFLSRVGWKTFARQKGKNLRSKSRLAALRVREHFFTQMAAKNSGYLPVREVFMNALARYNPGEFAGDVVLFVTEDTFIDIADSDKQWKAHVTGSIKVCKTSGDHYNLFRAPYVQELARHLNNALFQARK